MPHFSHISSDTQALTLKRLRQLSHLLDKALTVPGTPISIGLDPILGLIPVGGDFLGVMLSSYIILEAARLGAPTATLSRMVLNMIIDGLVGAIPILGDLFDFTWRANTYNIKLLEDYLKFPRQNKSVDKWFMFAVSVGLLLVAIVLIAFPVLIIGMLWKALTGT